MSITVKIVRVPGAVTELELNNGATVSDALSAAGLSASGFKLSVNGEAADTSDELENGDRVTLAKDAKGNA